jgi:hypothetical protein
MARRALGSEEGKRLSAVVQNGVYGIVAAKHIYSNPALNRFRKSFAVILPSAYLDAFEQTDLLCIDQEKIPVPIRDEIAEAIQKMNDDDDRKAIDQLSPEAKAFVYKVQVKTSSSASDILSDEDVLERDRFASARCRSKGFDNYDYLVLNSNRAREIVRGIR